MAKKKGSGESLGTLIVFMKDNSKMTCNTDSADSFTKMVGTT